MALQDRYSPIVLAKLRQTSVFADIVCRKYEGDPKAGAVKVPVRAEATVSAYNTASGLAGTETSTSFSTISIDQDYAVNEIIDGHNAAAVPDGMVAERLDSAGYGLGKKADDIILAAINHQTSGSYDCKTATQSQSTKISDLIIDMVAEAVTAGVDRDKCWAVVNPTNQAKLIKETQFTLCTALNDMEKGVIGYVAGVPVYMSSNSNFEDKVLVGNSDFIHFVADFMVPPTLRDGVGTYIGSAQVVARLVSGAAVTRPTTVIYKAS